MNGRPGAPPGFARAVAKRFGFGFVGLAAILFVPAGTWRYWEAWAYLAIVFVPMGIGGWFLLRRSPDLLARRFKVREKDETQKRIVAFSLVFFLGVIFIPGFDRRFGWSDVPTAVVLVADAVVLVGYVCVLLVMRENRFASRIIQVEEGQETITTGPYSVVRHPFYAGSVLFYLATPIALGSYWAALCAVPIVVALVGRIRGEEAILLRDLDGYADYVRKVRYRLVPRVW
jgi:protein-S-isoprenylcysteine O-methyltransferase Ste14